MDRIKTFKENERCEGNLVIGVKPSRAGAIRLESTDVETLSYVLGTFDCNSTIGMDCQDAIRSSKAILQLVALTRVSIRQL